MSMTKEDKAIVRLVYDRFMSSETEKWTELDDNMELMEMLNDKELILESRVKTLQHKNGIRCEKEHKSQGKCFAPFVLRAANIILDLGGELHPENAYVLRYYLAMSEMRLIFPTKALV